MTAMHRPWARVRFGLLVLLVLGSVAPSAAAQPGGARDEWPTDGWTTATPEAVRLDPAALAAVDARVPTEVPALSALLVVRGGRLAFEGYYNGQEPDEPVNVRSVTKSVTGALVGIALDEGALDGLDQTIGELIPERIPPGADPLVAEITIGRLLTMTSGLDWPTYGEWQALTGSEDWVEFALGRPVIDPTGSTYVYNTGGSHLLGVIVAEATGRPLQDYAQEKLFDPLGIATGEWMHSPQGEPSAGSGLELTPRDMAKFGLLHLNGGEWDGQQIVPADYVAAATSYQSLGDATGAYNNYGYQWWITTTGAGYPAYFALGYGGQHIFVVPDLDLVVVAAIARRLAPEELRTPRYLIESIAAAVTG